MKQTVKNILRTFIPLAVVITLLTGLIYATAQQVERISANDPQIQIAEDAALALSSGQSLDAVVPTNKIDIATSLAPFVVVFDDSGKPIATSGLFHNQLPSLPSAIFDYVRQNGEDRITWQPEPGVRHATVITRFGGAKPGFVMAGRSLREVEKRTDNLLLIAVIGGIAILIAAFVAVTLSELVFSGGAREILGDSIRFWERRRIIYNGILAAVVVGWLVLTWPHFRDALTFQSLVFLIVLALAANLCYTAAYLTDIPLQFSTLRARWRRWRLGLWLVGTCIAFVLTNYWIADEIYPYVR